MAFEFIDEKNLLAERHAGMMAMFRGGGIAGPIEYDHLAPAWPITINGDVRAWTKMGERFHFAPDPLDIIAVGPMPGKCGVIEA